MAERKKYDNINTPAGTLKWPKLTSIDYGTKEFPDKEGTYNTKLVLSWDDAVPLIEQLEVFLDEARSIAREEYPNLKVDLRKKLEKKNDDGWFLWPLYTEVFDAKTEEPTGDVEFSFKMKASGKKRDGGRWSRFPALFDAKGQTFPKGVDIWGGTTAKVAFQPRPYFISGSGQAGVSLSLEAVQVLELVAGGTRSAEQYGFGEEEGSCDASTIVVPEPKSDNPFGGDDVDVEAADADGGDF